MATSDRCSGRAPFLVRAELIGPGAEARADADPGLLASEVRLRHGTAVGLATVAREVDDDMRVEVGLDIDGRVSRVTHTIFRAGDIGRRRAANAGAAELWRRLAD